MSRTRADYLKISMPTLLVLSLILGIPVLGGGQGQIRIEPHAFDPPDPVMVPSPATFNITVVIHTAVNPQLLLVTSEACLNGLEGRPITISWDWKGPYYTPLGVLAESFEDIDKGWVPPEADGFGKIYQAKSLRDHLGVDDEFIYYYYVDMPVVGDQIADGDSYNVTITVPSTSPRVLVYVFGEESKVPPTRPGFVIPEIAFGTIATLATMVAALLLRGRITVLKQ